MEKAKLGDIIAVNRLGYQHFGIYSGNNNVVHYHKAESGKGTIMETSMREFLDGTNNYRVCEHKSDVGESVRNVIQSGNLWAWYSVWENWATRFIRIVMRKTTARKKPFSGLVQRLAKLNIIP